jgi:RNA polymerase sigma-70 factor, ECF subfamily
MCITHETVPGMPTGVGLNHTGIQQFEPEVHTQYPIEAPEFPERKERSLERQGATEGTQEQILALYDEYRPRLFRYLRSMKVDRDQAEEVIQETFMRLTTELLQQTAIENVPGWIVRVAHNLAIDLLKKRDRRVVHSSESEFALENCVDSTSSPEEAYLEKERAQSMEVALSQLSPQQRDCFHMRAQGFRYKDIAVALRISEQRAAFVVKQAAVRLAAICG